MKKEIEGSKLNEAEEIWLSFIDHEVARNDEAHPMIPVPYVTLKAGKNQEEFFVPPRAAQIHLLGEFYEIMKRKETVSEQDLTEDAKIQILAKQFGRIAGLVSLERRREIVEYDHSECMEKKYLDTITAGDSLESWNQLYDKLKAQKKFSIFLSIRAGLMEIIDLKKQSSGVLIFGFEKTKQSLSKIIFSAQSPILKDNGVTDMTARDVKKLVGLMEPDEDQIKYIRNTY